jgi:hypothetical protein
MQLRDPETYGRHHQAGHTPVTGSLPTYSFRFWVYLLQRNPPQYPAEKHRVAEAVIATLERSVGDIREAIEAIDVSTPATVIRYTGNWKGSYGGLALDARHRVQPVTQNPTGFAAVPDGGPMGNAGGLPVGPDDGAIRYPSGVSARSGTVRGPTGCLT